MLKSPIKILGLAVLIGIIICGSVSAADVTVDKTATSTGSDTATITLTANGPPETSSGADVVFSIDSSGSMFVYNDPEGLRKNASKNFIDKMNPTTDQAGVVNWYSQVQESQALTNDFTQAKTVIDQAYHIWGTNQTNYDVGLGESINLLDSGKKAGNSHNIIFLSDGYPEPSSSYTPPGTQGSKVDEAAAKGYKIFTIGLGSGIDPTILQTIAATTGGKYYFASDASALDPIFNEIRNQIKSTVTDVVVTDVLPSYIQLVGSPSIAPNNTVTNPDGTTTLTWIIGSLSSGEKWTTSLNVRSTQSGLLPTNVAGSSRVTYNGTDGDPQSVPFPTPYVNFVIPGTVTAANTIGMQTTGIPLGGTYLAILLVLSAFVAPKMRK